jgi:outer membrane protein assembly factor BamB
MRTRSFAFFLVLAASLGCDVERLVILPGLTLDPEAPPDEAPPDEAPPDEAPPDEAPPDEAPPDAEPPSTEPPPVTTCGDPGALLWRFPADGEPGLGTLFSSPVLAPDGSIRFGSADGRIYSVSPAGELQWMADTGSGALIASSPAIAPDGTLYVGSYDTHLHAVDNDGVLLWSFETGDAVNSSPALALDGTIYVGSADGNLYALDPSGALRWAVPTGGYVYSSPAVAADGTIVVANKAGIVMRIAPDGEVLWSMSPSSSVSAIDASPALAADGTLYVGADDNFLSAIDADGALLWRTAVGSEDYLGIDSSPTLAPDGTIYVANWQGSLVALDRGGVELWRFESGAAIAWSSPTIGADGTIYIGTKDAHQTGAPNRLLAIAPDGTLLWEHVGVADTLGFIDTSPMIAADGTLYIGTWGGQLLAFCSGSPGLATAGWPRFHNDAQGTGRRDGSCEIEIEVTCGSEYPGFAAEYTVAVYDAVPGHVTFAAPDLPDTDNFCTTGVGPLTTTAHSGVITASYDLGSCGGEGSPASVCSASVAYDCP